ncbi:MAG TPA: HrpB1 family type III secretion system apparatus protein [Caulifigura sp.]|nr:HrpB1 family type III secretion system apparatus protein [Caulifigura sp.]
MNVPTSLVQQLMEVGYLATGGGMAGEASTIFAAVEAVRPESELPLVGHGVTHLNAGKTNEGIAVLRKALEKNPDSEFAATFLGLALVQAGLSQAAEHILKQVVVSGKDPRAVELSRSLLSGE